MAVDTFLQNQVTETETLITAYNAAIIALTTGGVQSYNLNTGQTTQTVTNLNIKDLNDALDGLYNRRATLKARLYGDGGGIVKPIW
jgi:hypothetical protein